MGQLTGQVAVITGAGSGVGQATALASAGAYVVLIGRTQARLEETAALVAAQPGAMPVGAWVMLGDITVAVQVQRMIAEMHSRFGHVDILVNNAGFNIPRRTLKEITLEDWCRLIDANLEGTFLYVHAGLPLMRAQGGGTIIHIGSKASWRPTPVAGAGYTAAKAGVAALSAIINAEERQDGIRSTVILPGDVDTAILDMRPNPPPADIHMLALQSEDVAACVLLAVTLPARATVEELVLLPSRIGY